MLGFASRLFQTDVISLITAQQTLLLGITMAMFIEVVQMIVHLQKTRMVIIFFVSLWHNFAA